MKYLIPRLIPLLSLLVLASCSGAGGITPPSSSTPTETDETTFCSTETSYSPGAIASGTASFRKRGFIITQSGGVVTNATLGATIPTLLPIKYAEVRVLDSNSNLVQCGSTNSLGQLKALDGTSSLKIPNAAGNYTIEVYARANKTFPSAGKPVSATLSTAVKEDIYSNTIYKVTTTLSSNGSGGAANSDVTLTAQAQESLSTKVEGGAFNIYNDWVTAFEYLTSTSNTAALDVSCLNQKLDIFWKAGFNPAQYIYPDADPSDVSPLSFYLRDYSELYINGGSQDNITSIDTDHFDDAVVLHEMGHHIENVCGRMDSPGGTHFAQFRIDPRLAWSEGWGNFMGAHIIKNNIAKINPNLSTALPNSEWLHYNDTKGYNDGATATGTSLILMRLNKGGNDAANDSANAGAFDVVDAATYPGESHTREGSVSRGLFKAVNTCIVNCANGVTFDKFWKALGRAAGGMGISTSPFSSSAKFFEKVFIANGSSFNGAMATMMTNDESLHMVGHASYTVAGTSSSTGAVSTNSWPGYGIKLVTGASCLLASLQPRATTKTYRDDSDQRYTNHFYFFNKADLAGVTSIKLVPDSSCLTDMDLIIFNEDYSYNEDCTAYNSSDCTSVQKTTSSDVAGYSRSSGLSETVSISGFASGNYMVNVRGYSSTPNTISSASKCLYKLTDQNGVQLCPSTSY